MSDISVCTGFTSFKLDLSKGDQDCCIQGTFWAWVSDVRDGFDPLSDSRSYERCEGAGKTAVSWAYHCGHWYSQSHGRVGEMESLLFRATGNAATGFSYPFSIDFLTA